MGDDFVPRCRFLELNVEDNQLLQLVLLKVKPITKRRQIYQLL